MISANNAGLRAGFFLGVPICEVYLGTRANDKCLVGRQNHPWEF